MADNKALLRAAHLSFSVKNGMPLARSLTVVIKNLTELRFDASVVLVNTDTAAPIAEVTLKEYEEGR